MELKVLSYEFFTSMSVYILNTSDIVKIEKGRKQQHGMTSWKGLSSFWKSSLTPQQLRMPSLNKVEFLSIGIISVIALATIGTAIQVLSFLILCKRQFRKFHLTPYFLNIALANVLVITVDLPAVAISAFAEKQLMGDIFCQVRLIDQSWHRHAHTGQKKPSI